VRAVKGNVSDTKGLIAAMRRADFESVRGPFKYNVNHHPIQDFYLLKAVKKGGDMIMNVEKKVFEDHKDAYYKACTMKWTIEPS
jgi:branched-chain amino acid transport system substrate-binding protein